MELQLTAAAQAKRLLHLASQRLHTVDPLGLVTLNDALDASMPLPVGHRAYHGKLLEPNFTESAPADNLSFVMTTGGPGATAADQVETSTRTMRQIVGSQFGPQALRWLDGRIEPVRGRQHRALSWGAWFGSGFDRDGVMESQVTYEWGPVLMDGLPGALYQIARVAMNALPGLRPAFSTIRCGRTSGSQQVTFEVDSALPLNNVKPLMESLGLGAQHASLMSACAFILGARFTLPPNTATITLRPTRAGVEMRLDVNLDALPDTPPMLMGLLRLQMAERPKSVRALDRWLNALTPDGYEGPGDISTLSIWVRPDMPARVALYLRPAVLEAAPAQQEMPNDHEPQEPQPVTAGGESVAAAYDLAWAPQWR